jgi:hypothetical protein
MPEMGHELLRELVENDWHNERLLGPQNQEPIKSQVSAAACFIKNNNKKLFAHQE